MGSAQYLHLKVLNLMAMGRYISSIQIPFTRVQENNVIIQRGPSIFIDRNLVGMRMCIVHFVRYRKISLFDREILVEYRRSD